jgi:hypothetical protein
MGSVFEMLVERWGFRSLALVVVLATCGMALGQNGAPRDDMGTMKDVSPARPAESLPLGPGHNSGASITGAFEGWFGNHDGTYSLLVGYYNRNLREAVDVPIGPDNDIEPGGPDQGQPTHFLPGRVWGIFTVKVPKDFGNKTLTWTITVNGMKTSIPLNLATLSVVNPFEDAQGDRPPYIGFSANGPFLNGPVERTESLTTTVGTPLPLKAWIADDAKAPLESDDIPALAEPVRVEWSMFRGTGEAQFGNEKPDVEETKFNAPPGAIFNGTATTAVTFNEPGEYELNMLVLDSTGRGGGGFQCCWSNAKVKVSVK